MLYFHLICILLRVIPPFIYSLHLSFPLLPNNRLCT